MNPVWNKAKLALLMAVFFTPGFSPGQTQAGAAGQSSTATAGYQSQDSESSGTTTAGAPSLSSGPSQNPYLSSVPEGKATGGVIQLSFKDAIDRALRNNLGLLLASDSSLAARGAKWQELSHLLPNVNGAVSQSAEQLDLAALGFRFNFPGVS